MNLDWLRAFAVFARHRNFTRAADELHLSQPALHAQIRKLSEELDIVLYRRRGRALELTRAGQEVARFAREMAERTAAFRDALAGRDAEQPVVLAAGEGAYLYLLGPAIEAFTRAGAAPLRLVTADAAGAIEAVRAGAAHLAVAALAAGVAPPEGIAARRVARVGQILVVPVDHPLAGQQASLSALAGVPLVVPPRDRPHRRALEAALGAAGMTLQVAVEASGWPQILHFVRLGLGLAVVNAFCALPDGFAAAPLPELPARDYLLMHAAGARLPAPARSLAERIAGA